MRTKTVLSCALALFLSLGSVHAGNWTTDYKAALAQAKAQNKLVLLDFTGSDWCGYCKLLESEVLSKPDFDQFASGAYILVKIDFPQGTPLPEDQKFQNDTLQKQFQIQGFPTLVVLDGAGKELGRQVGYDPGSGSGPVIQQLKSFSPAQKNAVSRQN